MSATACWRANIPKEAMRVPKKLRSFATKERQDLQNTLASVGYFLSRDAKGKLELWTCSLNAEYPVPYATGETCDTVEGHMQKSSAMLGRIGCFQEMD